VTAEQARVTAIYTGRGLEEQVMAAAAEILPGVTFTSILDSSVILDINADGGITPATVRRMLRYYENAADSGATVIFNTCSSVGDIVPLGRQAIAVPIVQIDEAMADEAVTGFDRIGVLATLPSTLHPTSRLLSRRADAAGRVVRMTSVVADGAYQALAAGHPDQHDRLVADAVGRLGQEVDVVVLAQASMARMRDRLAASANVPVLTSLHSGLRAVGAELSRQRRAA
jgi:Asp/Glu/hydantoin racemase